MRSVVRYCTNALTSYTHASRGRGTTAIRHALLPHNVHPFHPLPHHPVPNPKAGKIRVVDASLVVDALARYGHAHIRALEALAQVLADTATAVHVHVADLPMLARLADGYRRLDLYHPPLMQRLALAAEQLVLRGCVRRALKLNAWCMCDDEGRSALSVPCVCSGSRDVCRSVSARIWNLDVQKGA